MSTTSRTSAARVVEPVRPGRMRERFTLASSGVWAAAQAWVLSFAVVALLAVSAVLDAPSASGSDGGLGAGVSVAAGLWLLGHGVPLSVGGTAVTVVPLGITALALFTVHVTAKRSAVPTLAAWIGGTVTYAAGTVALAVALDLGATAAAREPVDVAIQVGAALLGGLVIGGGGQALGMFSAPDGPLLAGITPRLDPYLPDTARLGLRAGVVGAASLVVLGGLLSGVWLVLGRETSAEIAGGLGAGWLGTAVLLLGQAALVPNLALWASAWVAGPGFAVGAGSTFSPAVAEAGALPSLPLLGALPGQAWTTPYAAWAPVLAVACGALAGWFAWRQLEPGLVRVRDLVWTMAGVVVAASGVTALLQWVAGGAAGAGTLAQVGADPLVVAGLVAVEVGGGAVLVLGGAFAWNRWGTPAGGEGSAAS